MRRRYVVKMVTSWPGSSGPAGAKHLASAEALFDRREVQGPALAAIARCCSSTARNQQILRSKGTNGPVKTAGLFGW